MADYHPCTVVGCHLDAFVGIPLEEVAEEHLGEAVYYCSDAFAGNHLKVVVDYQLEVDFCSLLIVDC